MKRLLIALIFPLGIWAQSDSPINTVSLGLPNIGYQQIFTYDSGSNLEYVCLARSASDRSNITVSAATTANPVVFTATAHGLDFPTVTTITPAIFISGGTGNWTAVNGMFVATPLSANTFSIPVDSTAFTAFAGQTLTVVTRATKTTALLWAINKKVWSAGKLLWSGWATDTTGSSSQDLVGGSPSFKFACASRTTYSYQ